MFPLPFSLTFNLTVWNRKSCNNFFFFVSLFNEKQCTRKKFLPTRFNVIYILQVIDKSMPVFNKQFYSDTVPENIELHSPLSVAIQAESPLGRKLIYTIVKGNELEEFAVDFNTGNATTYNIFLFCYFILYNKLIRWCYNTFFSYFFFLFYFCGM